MKYGMLQMKKKKNMAIKITDEEENGMLQMKKNVAHYS